MRVAGSKRSLALRALALLPNLVVLSVLSMLATVLMLGPTPGTSHAFAAGNQSPTANDDIVPGFSLNEDDPATVLDVLANDTDPDPGDTLAVQSSTQPALGGVASVANGVLRFTPTPDFSGNAQFTYTVTDGNGGSDVASVLVHVVAVNDPPMPVNDSISVPKDGFRRSDPSSNDTDPEGSVLSVAGVTQPPAGQGMASVFDSRFVDYTPPLGFVGMTSFTYTVADAEGATAVGTIFVQVTGDNAPPVANPDSGDAIQNGDAIVIDVLDNDTDADQDNLVVVMGSVTNPPHGAAFLLVDGTVRYTPDLDFVGPDSFTYVVSDGRGGTDTGTVSVEVADSNLSPVASPDHFVVQAGALNVLNVLSNDFDPEGSPLIITSVLQPATAGTAQISGGGTSINLTVVPGFTGNDQIFYIIKDAGGATASAFAFIRGPQVCNGLLVTIDMSLNGGSGVGTAGDDVILGTDGDDIIDGGDGNDTICAGEGDDQVVGGTGDDTIFAEGGRDIVRGNPGNDIIDGGPGADRLLGGIHDDTITGGQGDDYIGGFGGDDVIDGGAGNETIFGGFGADTINGGLGADTVFGLIGDDVIDGGAGNDELNGDRGNDTIRGGSGDDIVNGGNANDTLDGEAGDDIVSGGKADDDLAGGTDTDVCSGNLHSVADTVDDTCETFFGIP